MDTRGQFHSEDHSFFFDVMRGLSAQMVLVGHALNVCFPALFMVEAGGGVLEARRGLFFIQNLGVLIFFCISGYLVTASVMRRAARPSYGLPDYLMDRFARIFTPLVPLLLILYVVENTVFHDGDMLRYGVLHSSGTALLLNLTMLFDHPVMSALARVTGWMGLKAGAMGSAAQLWTVVIEWWIYVTFGLLAFAAMKRLSFSLTWAIALAGAAALPAYAMARGHGLVVAWLAGMLFALAQRSLRNLPREMLAVLCTAGSGLCAAALFLNGADFYSPVVALLFATSLFTMHTVAAPLMPILRQSASGRLLRGLSDISYSVYLVHLSVLIWTLSWAPQLTGRVWPFILLVIVCNIVAIAFHWAFERHYVRVRGWLAALRTASAPNPRESGSSP